MNLRKLLLPVIALLAMATSAWSQSVPRAAGPALYAVNAAAISAAMSYCMTKYGPLTLGSAGDACLKRARNLLAGYGLKQEAERIDGVCREPGRFNTCITPEIGRLVISLNTLFKERRI
jgi:hypothetical protein